MAGDWIKMRGNLWDDPRVAKLVDMTDTSEAQVIGGLYWLWATADQHTEDGFMPGLTLRQIDRKTGVPGLGAALVSISWIEETEDGIRILNFEEHNGQSAKRRASDAQRKANVRNMSAPDADKEQTNRGRSVELEKEKRREEEEGKSKAESATATRLPADWIPPPEFVDFCKTERPDLDPRAVGDRFRDHWIAQPGKDGRKTNWLATWRNWVRRERVAQQPRASPSGYESAKDRSRREAAEKLTGRSNHEQRSPDFIDINEPGSHFVG